MNRTSSARLIVVLAAILSAAGCNDSTGPGGCDVSYVVVESSRAPDTGLRFLNDLDGGLQLIVGGERITDIGSDMGAGTCEVYGLFPGIYEVRLRQCRQNESGSTACTSYIGPQLVRNLTVTQGRITELRVTRSFFP